MKWVALCAGFAACGITTAAIAEDAQPPLEAPAGDVSGTWQFIVAPTGGFATGVENHGQNPASCTLAQTGNELTGTCKTVSVAGPITGTISGEKITWRWVYNAGDIRGRVFYVDLFEAKLADDRIKGGYKTYPALDPKNPTFDIKKDSEFKRSTSFSARRE